MSGSGWRGRVVALIDSAGAAVIRWTLEKPLDWLGTPKGRVTSGRLLALAGVAVAAWRLWAVWPGVQAAWDVRTSLEGLEGRWFENRLKSLALTAVLEGLFDAALGCFVGVVLVRLGIALSRDRKEVEQ